MAILITGKKNAGKTTYATRLVQEMLDTGIKAVALDGDVYRKETGNDDYSDAGRQRNLLGVAGVAAELGKQGHVVAVGFVAPRRAWRDEMRRYWKVSRVVYLPGGELWPNTTYEVPSDEEFNIRRT